MSRKNVGVTARFSVEGQLTPISIQWEDGRTFEIDRIIDVRKAASLKAGGIGTRYTCRIRKKHILLYRDEDLWYIEVDD